MVPDLALLTMARLIDAIAYSRVTTAIVAFLLAPAERPERRVPREWLELRLLGGRPRRERLLE
jgi:hypothetical protein